MKKQFNYECWINNESKTLSFHLVDNYIKETFSNYKDFFTYVIKKSQRGYKVQ